MANIDSITPLRNGELTILAGRPSMGKTALALNIAANVARMGNEVLFFSLEMSRSALAERLLAIEAQIGTWQMQTGRFSEDGLRKLVAASAALSGLPLTIDDSPVLKIADVGAIARRHRRQRRLKLIVVDYLQLITPEESARASRAASGRDLETAQGHGPRVRGAGALPGATQPAVGTNRKQDPQAVASA